VIELTHLAPKARYRIEEEIRMAVEWGGET